jgi:hypothetical protein
MVVRRGRVDDHGGLTVGPDVRSPLQGGLPPVGAVDGAVVEIACDESGFSGRNLLYSGAPLITHGSVDLTRDESVELITALRSRFRLSARELKSGQFLRHRGAAEAVEWFLRTLPGRARIHLIDKEFFLVTRVVDLLLADASYAAGTRLTEEGRPAAVALYRAGRTAGSDWTGFLSAFVDLVRTKRRKPADETTERFLRARDTLAGHDLGRSARTVLGGLSATRVRHLVARLDNDDATIPPPLEPMLTALAETVLSWSEQRRRVLVIHDEQSALTASRLTRLQQVLAEAGPVSPLAGLIMVDSRDDPRVQVADLLAGVARRSPGTALLRPLFIPTALRVLEA